MFLTNVLHFRLTFILNIFFFPKDSQALRSSNIFIIYSVLKHSLDVLYSKDHFLLICSFSAGLLVLHYMWLASFPFLVLESSYLWGMCLYVAIFFSSKISFLVLRLVIFFISLLIFLILLNCSSVFSWCSFSCGILHQTVHRCTVVWCRLLKNCHLLILHTFLDVHIYCALILISMNVLEW